MTAAEDRLREARQRHDAAQGRVSALKDRIGELRERKAAVIGEACGDLEEAAPQIAEINAELRTAIADLDDLEAAVKASERALQRAEADVEQATAAEALQRARVTVVALLDVSARADAALADLLKALAERRELGRELRRVLPKDEPSRDLANRLELRSVVSAALAQAGLGEFADVPRWDGIVPLGAGLETHDRGLFGGLAPPETGFRVRSRGFGRWYVFDATGEKLAGPFRDKAEAEVGAAKLWDERPPEPPQVEQPPPPSADAVPPPNPGQPGFGVAPAGFGRFSVVDGAGNNVAGPYRSKADALRAAHSIAAATTME